MNKILKRIIFTAVCLPLLPAFTARAEEAASYGWEQKAYDMEIHTIENQPVVLKGLSVEGSSMAGMTQDEVTAWINDYVDKRMKKHLQLTVLEDNVYHYDSQTLGVTWKNPEVVYQISQYLNNGNLVQQYKHQKDLENNPVDLDITFTYDETFLEDQIMLLTGQFSREPVNATVERIDGSFKITPEVPGITFDTESIINEVAGAMFNMDSAESIEYDFPYTNIAPRVTAFIFENFAPQPLGSFTTGNLGGENRSHNIELSISRVNGKLIMPGEEVSALGLYGPQTEESGYLEAPGYEDGNQVPAIGGGVCQTTTTMYNAILRAELTVLKRYGHSMLVTYVPPAMDAAVSEGVKDLVFRNDYANPVYMEAYIGRDVNGKKNIT
ncbi:MAG: VanW family protein, partial [Parasporobacterium sp.]|nr:VanW family protein [Parasporobacterium sp.]